MTGFDQADPASLGIFGSPEIARRDLAAYEASGVDQVILVAQAGGYPHQRIMDSLRLFGREVLPEFKARDLISQREKEERLTKLKLPGLPAAAAS